MTGAGRQGAATPLLVYGLGRSGLAVLRRALAGPPEGLIAFYEARAAGPDVSEALSLGAERVHDVSAWQAAQGAQPLVVAAPGVPIDHPDLNALRGVGAEVIGEVEWSWRRVPGRYVGVTGTAGKGSVTRWCGDTLQAAGVDVVVGGNIEPALAAVAREGATHVVELSSFQLERCPTFAPQVAVALNLGVDHLDRHGSVAAYHRAKRNLLEPLAPGSHLVLNADDPNLKSWAEEASSRGIEVHRYSLSVPASPEPDAYLAADGSLVLHGAPLVHRSELRVLGEHQLSNALAVALVCAALGLERGSVADGLRAFAGLPGRYSPAGQVGDVRFVDDSIATRPLAVAAALRATPGPLVWLAGGQAKGGDYAELRELVKARVDLLITFGASAELFAREFGGATQVVRCQEATGAATMRALVEAALEHLRRHHGGAGNVLLAPLATSFDQFTDYQERGRAFRAAIAAAGGNPQRASNEVAGAS